MGSEGGRVGYMSGGTTWSDTGKKRLARMERYKGKKVAEVVHANKANLGPKTFFDGPAGGRRRVAANRFRRVLTRAFGNAGGWGTGRGANHIGVRWGRSKGWARPSSNADGSTEGWGTAGRRQLNSLTNTAAKRRELRRQGITLGRAKKTGRISPDGRPIYERPVLIKSLP